MKLNLSKMFFFSFMILGIMMCISSNNWILIWCGLEFSMISFIPMITNSMVSNSESSMKYFLIQSIGSAILILGFILFMNEMLKYSIFMLTALMLKMGLIPFHIWIFSVMEGISMIHNLILITFMKIGTITIMSYFVMISNLFLILGLIISSISGINQSSIRKLIGYSSIFNTTLLMTVICLNESWLTFFFIYCILTSIIMMNFSKMNFNYINQIVINNKSTLMNIYILTNLTSLGGLPPFLGFFSKLIVFQCIITKSMMLLVIIILMSLLLMFFYMRMTFLSVMMFSISQKIKSKITQKTNMIWILINTFSLPMILSLKLFL